MKIAITTYSLDNKDFREQLSSLLKYGIKPDFIILHYGGIYRFYKAINFLRKTLKQYRIKSILFLSQYSKKRGSIPVLFKISEDDSKEVDRFIASAKIIKAKGINDKSTIRTIHGLGDMLIAANSGKLNAEVLSISNAVFLNVHASKLPLYRGMNNVEWALWENNEIYATIHRISVGIDEGDILYQEKINTEGAGLTSIQEYRAYCFFKSNELIGKAVKGYIDNTLLFAKQNALKNPIAQYYVMHPILKEHLQKKLQGNKT